jgi:hypothetical protein
MLPRGTEPQTSDLLEVMSTSVYTCLNPFKCIRKHYVQITGIALQPLFNKYGETTVQFDGKFDAENQIYVP